MTRLLTNHICTMTELREPHKVLERSGGKPVAILRNSALVGYLVPAEAVQAEENRYATAEELAAVLRDTADEARPILDYLRDK